MHAISKLCAYFVSMVTNMMPYLRYARPCMHPGNSTACVIAMRPSNPDGLSCCTFPQCKTPLCVRACVCVCVSMQVIKNPTQMPHLSQGTLFISRGYEFDVVTGE